MMPRNCNFCGLCCTIAVKVTEAEIKRIESLGHNRNDFTEKDDGGNTILQRPTVGVISLSAKTMLASAQFTTNDQPFARTFLESQCVT